MGAASRRAGSPSGTVVKGIEKTSGREPAREGGGSGTLDVEWAGPIASKLAPTKASHSDIPQKYSTQKKPGPPVGRLARPDHNNGSIHKAKYGRQVFAP